MINNARQPRPLARSATWCWPRLGPAGYASAIVHLLTTVLHLGSGAIHAMHEEQDMRRYGVCAPPCHCSQPSGLCIWRLAGYRCSRLLLQGCNHRGRITGIRARGRCRAAAGVTGHHMTRVMPMTFFGESWTPGAHPDEAPAAMTWPMILPAVGSVFLRWPAVGGTRRHWLQPVVGSHEEPPMRCRLQSPPPWRSVCAVGIAVPTDRHRADPGRVALVRVMLTAAARGPVRRCPMSEVFMRPGAIDQRGRGGRRGCGRLG